MFVCVSSRRAQGWHCRLHSPAAAHPARPPHMGKEYSDDASAACARRGTQKLKQTAARVSIKAKQPPLSC